MLCFGVVFGWVDGWMLIVALIVLFMCRICPSLAFWVLAAMFGMIVSILVCGLVLLWAVLICFWVVILSLILSCYCAICGCLILGLVVVLLNLFGFGYCGTGCGWLVAGGD